MARGSEGRKLVKMSELAKLAGVPAPTIKHYIREGLLPGPAQRTSRNMAYYDVAIADRVRVIKELQSRHYLPLKLIGELLEPAPSAEIRRTLDARTRKQLGGLPKEILAARAVAAQHGGAKGTPSGRSRSEVLESLEVSAEDLDLLARLELVAPTEGASGQCLYGPVDLELLEVIDETRRKGLGDLFPMEILPPYKKAVQALVQMELDLFQRRVLDLGSLNGLTVENIAEEALTLGERLIAALRARLLMNAARLGALPASAPPRKASSKKTTKKAAKKATKRLRRR